MLATYPRLGYIYSLVDSRIETIILYFHGVAYSLTTFDIEDNKYLTYCKSYLDKIKFEDPWTRSLILEPNSTTEILSEMSM